MSGPKLTRLFTVTRVNNVDFDRRSVLDRRRVYRVRKGLYDPVKVIELLSDDVSDIVEIPAIEVSTVDHLLLLDNGLPYKICHCFDKSRRGLIVAFPY